MTDPDDVFGYAVFCVSSPVFLPIIIAHKVAASSLPPAFNPNGHTDCVCATAVYFSTSVRNAEERRGREAVLIPTDD